MQNPIPEPCGLDSIAAVLASTEIGAREISTALMILTWIPVLVMVYMHRRGARTEGAD